MFAIIKQHRRILNGIWSLQRRQIPSVILMGNLNFLGQWHSSDRSQSKKGGPHRTCPWRGTLSMVPRTCLSLLGLLTFTRVTPWAGLTFTGVTLPFSRLICILGNPAMHENPAHSISDGEERSAETIRGGDRHYFQETPHCSDAGVRSLSLLPNLVSVTLCGLLLIDTSSFHSAETTTDLHRSIVQVLPWFKVSFLYTGLRLF